MADHTDLGETANSAAASAVVGNTVKTGQDRSTAHLSVQVEEMRPLDPAQKESRGDVVEGEAVGDEADDTGLVRLESLCMNCHEDVCSS